MSYRRLSVVTLVVLAGAVFAGQQLRALEGGRGPGARAGVATALAVTPTSSTSSTSLGFFGSTTTTTTLAPVVCGDANGDGVITATDALMDLISALGLRTCALCVCDTNNSGAISAVDALVILNIAVGQPITAQCPAC